MGNLIILFASGAMLIILGIINMRGNISSIHWYNRKNVSDEDIPKYGKCIGLGTLIIGIAMLLCGIFEILFSNPLIYSVIVIGCLIGLILILYGQFKYNRGLF